MDRIMDLCEYTEYLWKLYSVGETPAIEKEIFRRMPDDVVIIGTGRHEYYEDLEQFKKSVSMEDNERSQIKFRIEKFWCEEKKLNELTSLVHGNLHLIGTGISQNVLVDMETRFTMIYCREEDDWKLVHIHQSLPYTEQRQGEYYPKTLLDQATELEMLAKTDLLTGILNHQAFYNLINNLPKEQETGYFMIIDLDDFKRINDTYGHLYGDNILKEFASVLKEVTGEHDYAGRIGGDEFALFCGNPDCSEEAEALAGRIISLTAEKGRRTGLHMPGISIGIASKKAGMSSMQVMKQADARMYEAKQNGKNRYRI